ncbi:hypothetical protein MMC13_007746 [Lambiella insularis]|nr:hypothetical protein [Lambiella insularis]
MPFFSNIFKGKESTAARKQNKQYGAVPVVPAKPKWVDAWTRKEVEPEEVQELLRCCTYEIKSRALDTPFLLLPFRPASDPSAARSFIRNYFNPSEEKGGPLEGERLEQELRLTEPLVVCSVMKWCWSRLAGGVVTWEAYELFRIGEQDSNTARDAFATFIPISVASDARTKIIFDFFDLIAAIAAHGKTNGMGGRKLSRLAGWYAFEQVDTNNGFDGGYKAWESAADATSHLFFAYLRSLSPDSVQGSNGISALPLSLQKLLESTEYPPEQSMNTESQTTKVVMIVERVSATPFALLRRAKNFQYRDDDQALQQFSEYEDPVQALTDECRRVLKSISSANVSSTSKASTSLKDPSWSRFEDVGFGGLGDDSDPDDEIDGSALGRKRQPAHGLSATAQSKVDLGRPTTPSWADFLSSGFVDDPSQSSPRLLLPPDKVLPPINTSRSQSAQSQRRMTEGDSSLEPGELASIATFRLDDAFWWVWISSLAGEEPIERKAVFGRCALVETNIRGGRWLLMEEIIKAAAPELEEGAYIAEKKGIFGFSKRSRMNRSKSTHGRKPLPPRKSEPVRKSNPLSPPRKTNIAPDQHARIQAAAAALQQKHHLHESAPLSPRRGRHEDTMSTKTNSVFTLQPVILTEAAPAMKWANSYDKNAIRAKYLGDNFAGKGSAVNLAPPTDTYSQKNASTTNGSITPLATAQTFSTPMETAPSHLAPKTTGKPQPLPAPRYQSYGFPSGDKAIAEEAPSSEAQNERNLPALPQEVQQEVPQETRQGSAKEYVPEPLRQSHQEAPPVQEYIAPGGKPSQLQQEYGGTSAVSDSSYQRSYHPQNEEIPSSQEQVEEVPTPIASPAPMPATPAIDLVAANKISAEAAKIPLPAAAPIGSPRPMPVERKPIPPPKEPVEQFSATDPASFVSGPEYMPRSPVTTVIHNTPDTSPESKKTVAKLKKKGAGGGFKSMFGKKKTEASPVRPGLQQSSSTAVAAARAALEARQNPPQRPAPAISKDAKLSRRFSSLGKKQQVENIPASAPVVKRTTPPSMPLMKEEPPTEQVYIAPGGKLSQWQQTSAVEPISSVPSPRYGNEDFHESQASLSRVDTNEQRHAEREFQTFDQGPLDDVPAFIPEDSPRQSSHVDERRDKEHFPDKEEARDDISEQSNELTYQVSPAQDRWAQIRKNAAARAAQQNEGPSEEQSRRTETDRTDDGETSGEETIESRVARIKARVAELTGNMQSSATDRR